MTLNQKEKVIKFIKATSILVGITFCGLNVIARIKKNESVYKNDPEQKNPLEGRKVIFIKNKKDNENADGVRGHLEPIGNSEYKPGMYEKYIKRVIDVILSFGGLLILSPIYFSISLAIIIDDPGPVLFTQKRVGKNKKYFKLHKFRSMKMCTPHDVPTHMLDNPEQYITRVGKFLRTHSLDELPQIWDIFIGNMSIIGPRPGLWNQDVLIAERDKYSANDVKPGLTGWAQINGRDELEISVKAQLDGEYVKKIGLVMDLKCFLRSIGVFAHDDSVVEGGTGEMKKVCRHYTDEKAVEELIGNIGFNETVKVNRRSKKKVLITGEGSYIGEYFQAYAKKMYKENFEIETLNLHDENWKEKDFSLFDIVYHVAGIAHADVESVDEETKEKYYAINTDLALEVCKKAKTDKAKEFIFMSSMIIYGNSAPYGEEKIINANTVPEPANFYGDSKLQADVAVRELADDDFKVIVLRPPMIYGKDSKGNYPILAKMARKLPIFPDVDNKRSMLYIDDFCELLCQCMLIDDFSRNAVVLIPQNKEWTKTTDMVEAIANASGRKIKMTKALTPVVKILGKIPGKVGSLINKAFGNSCYEQRMSVYAGINYQRNSLEQSIIHTEKDEYIDSSKEKSHTLKTDDKRHILVVSQYFYPEAFRINDICREWVKRGYKVTVITGIPNYPMGKFFDGYGYIKKRKEIWKGITIVRIPTVPRGNSSVGMIANYISFIVSGYIKNFFTNIKADYVFTFEVSPMTQALIGCWYAKKHNVPHYLYVQDLWPENVMTVTGIKNPFVIKPIDKMVDYIYANTNQIFATSPSFVETICNRKVKVSKEKVHYWPQYAEDFYVPCEKKTIPEIPYDNSFKIIFTGNIGTAQGLQILPKTAELLKEENIRFVIVGDGRYLAEFKQEIRKHGVQKMFTMISHQPAEKIPEMLAMCDVAFLSFQDDDLWSKTIPAKLQSYMACGMPVIASAKGETVRIIKEAKCGLWSKIGNAEELAKNIRYIKGLPLLELNTMRDNARNYYIKNFNKKVLFEQMERFF